MFRFQLAVSLDGFVAGPDQSEETPLGVGGLELQGGEVYASTLVVEEAQSNVGAT
jgi:hypothetical protein